MEPRLGANAENAFIDEAHRFPSKYEMTTNLRDKRVSASLVAKKKHATNVLRKSAGLGGVLGRRDEKFQEERRALQTPAVVWTSRDREDHGGQAPGKCAYHNRSST